LFAVNILEIVVLPFRLLMFQRWRQRHLFTLLSSSFKVNALYQDAESYNDHEELNQKLNELDAIVTETMLIAEPKLCAKKDRALWIPAHISRTWQYKILEPQTTAAELSVPPAARRDPYHQRVVIFIVGRRRKKNIISLVPQ
jgi:hypothetical protein